MRIQVTKRIQDSNDIGLPHYMIGKTYNVLKEETNGVWVKEGMLEAFILRDEFQIIQLSEDNEKNLYSYLSCLLKK